MRYRFIVPIVLIVLLTTGCSIRFSNNRVRDGGIFRSTDYAEHWEQKVFVRQEKKQTITISDVDVANIFPSPFSPDEFILATFAHGLYGTTNGGDSWQQTTINAGNYQAFSFDPANPSILYTASGRNIMKSADSGGSWDIIYTDTRGEGIVALVVDPYDSSKLYAGTTGGTILKSVNYGNDWSVKHTINDPVRTIFFRADDSRIVYVVTTNKGLERSPDGGETWMSLLKNVATFPGAGVVYQGAYSKNLPMAFYAATNYGLIKSPDGGETWQAIKTLLPANSVPVRTVGVDPANVQILYFTVNNLLHKSEDGGTTWRTIETIPSGRLIVRMLVHPTRPGTVFLGTFKTK